MKKKILFKLANVTTLLALLLSTTIGCSEDENDDDDKTPAQEVAGNYTGKADVSITGTEPLQDLTATANVSTGSADDKVDLTIKANDVPGYGNIQLDGEDLILTKTTDGNYSITGTLNFELVTGTTPIPVPLVTGTTVDPKNGKLDLKLELQLETPPMQVAVSFTGNK